MLQLDVGRLKFSDVPQVTDTNLMKEILFRFVIPTIKRVRRAGHYDKLMKEAINFDASKKKSSWRNKMLMALNLYPRYCKELQDRKALGPEDFKKMPTGKDCKKLKPGF